MNKTQIAATTVAVVGVTVAVTQSRSYNQDLYNRFPEHDRKIVRQAFRKLMVKAVTGQYEFDMQQMTDEQMDVLFQIEYDKILNKK